MTNPKPIRYEFLSVAKLEEMLKNPDMTESQKKQIKRQIRLYKDEEGNQ